jgi:hypothetical protein
MAWLTNFLIGRPGYEYSMSVPPEAISIEDMSINVKQRMLDGTMKKSIINPSMPNIKLSSKYLTVAQRNQLSSLTMIDDTFLSFQTRDDWQVISLKVLSASTTQVILPKMSCTRLSKLLVDGGFSSTITIETVNETPNPADMNTYDSGGYGEGGYAGSEHYTGGSYDDSNYTINLGVPLGQVQYVYVTFTYKGWLVEAEKLSHNTNGNNVDWFGYDFQLTSA